MSPQIVKNKLDELSVYLKDLKEIGDCSYEEFLKRDHYAVERLLEQLVITAHDAVAHVLAIRGEEMPMTLRTTFLRAGEMGILSAELAEKLAQAAGMRNLIVHAYTKVDLRQIYDSIKPAIADFSEFARVLAKSVGI